MTYLYYSNFYVMPFYPQSNERMDSAHMINRLPKEKKRSAYNPKHLDLSTVKGHPECNVLNPYPICGISEQPIVPYLVILFIVKKIILSLYFPLI